MAFMWKFKALKVTLPNKTKIKKKKVKDETWYFVLFISEYGKFFDDAYNVFKTICCITHCED